MNINIPWLHTRIQNECFEMYFLFFYLSHKNVTQWKDFTMPAVHGCSKLIAAIETFLWSSTQASNLVSCLRFMRKNGGSVGSYIRCVFPWERCVCLVGCESPFLGVLPLETSKRGHSAKGHAHQPLGLLDNAREKQAMSHRDQHYSQRNTKEFHINT
jgi:hypothetical protein